MKITLLSATALKHTVGSAGIALISSSIMLDEAWWARGFAFILGVYGLRVALNIEARISMFFMEQASQKLLRDLETLYKNHEKDNERKL